MITLGDLVFRCVLCLMLVFFLGLLFDVLGVLKRLGRQRATGHKVDGVDSDGKDQTVSFESVQEADAATTANAPNPVATDLEANPTCVDKDACVVYRVNLSTGKYGFCKNNAEHTLHNNGWGC
jgi:hypothetical protein